MDRMSSRGHANCFDDRVQWNAKQLTACLDRHHPRHHDAEGEHEAHVLPAPVRVST